MEGSPNRTAFSKVRVPTRQFEHGELEMRLKLVMYDAKSMMISNWQRPDLHPTNGNLVSTLEIVLFSSWLDQR